MPFYILLFFQIIHYYFMFTSTRYHLPENDEVCGRWKIYTILYKFSQ